MLMLCAAAEVVSPSDDFYYLDQADVLSDETEGEIFFCNELLVEACGAEIVVVTVSSTGSMSIDDYAYTLFNDWEIGGESYLGYLLLMAIDDEDYYAMPGTDLSDSFDSATIQDYNDTYLEPDFAAGDYDAAAKRYFEAVFEHLCDALNLSLTVDMGVADYNEYVQENPSWESDSGFFSGARESSDSEGGLLMEIIIIVVVVLVILLVASVSRLHHRPGDYDAPPPPPRGRGSFFGGYILGRMSRPRPRRNPPPPGPGGHPGFGGQPGPGPSARPHSFGGFGGASRGSRPGGFGGASRGSRPSGVSRSSRSGGFGGASRTGGASRGPSTRGGGAGRGRR